MISSRPLIGQPSFATKLPPTPPERDFCSCLGMVSTTGSEACWAETVESKSRESVLTLLELIELDHELE